MPQQSSKHSVHPSDLLVIRKAQVKAFKMNGAHFLARLDFLLTKAKDHSGNSLGEVHGGRRWIYNTAEHWTSKSNMFWMSQITFRRLVDKLESQGFILSRDDLNKRRYDNTKWYTIVYEKYDAAIEQAMLYFDDKPTDQNDHSVSKPTDQNDHSWSDQNDHSWSDQNDHTYTSLNLYKQTIKTPGPFSEISFLKGINNNLQSKQRTNKKIRLALQPIYDRAAADSGYADWVLEQAGAHQGNTLAQFVNWLGKNEPDENERFVDAQETSLGLRPESEVPEKISYDAPPPPEGPDDEIEFQGKTYSKAWFDSLPEKIQECIRTGRQPAQGVPGFLWKGTGLDSNDYPPLTIEEVFGGSN